jgi:hypothetical protein
MRILSLLKLATAKRVANGLMAAGLAFGLAVSASAQTNLPKPPDPRQKVFGWQDAKTGVFHPMLKIEPDLTPAPITGMIELTITITLKTAVPTGGTVYCSTDITAASNNTETFETGAMYDESSYSVAKVTGTTATCTVITPYSWILPAASSTVQNSLSSVYVIGILPASTSTTAVLSELDGRSSTGPFGGTAIPATGATTKYTLAATL